MASWWRCASAGPAPFADTRVETPELAHSIAGQLVGAGHPAQATGEALLGRGVEAHAVTWLTDPPVVGAQVQVQVRNRAQPAAAKKGFRPPPVGSDALYRDHIALEESLVYPAAKRQREALLSGRMA